MIQAAGLRWILTVLFVLPAAYAVWRTVAGHDGRHAGRAGAAARIAHALHGVMAAAMAAMVWSWGMDLPAWPQVVFFALAALWLAGIALALPGEATRFRALLTAFPHALVMGAMAWMVHAMAAAMRGHHGVGDAMEQASGAHAQHATDASAISSMTLQGGARAVAGALAVILLALTLWWLARAFDLARADGGAVARRSDRAATAAQAMGRPGPRLPRRHGPRHGGDVRTPRLGRRRMNLTAELATAAEGAAQSSGTRLRIPGAMPARRGLPGTRVKGYGGS